MRKLEVNNSSNQLIYFLYAVMSNLSFNKKPYSCAVLEMILFSIIEVELY